MALGGAREEAGIRFGAQEGTDAGLGRGEARSLRSLDRRLPLWKVSCQGAEGPLREAELAGTREAGVAGRRGSGEEASARCLEGTGNGVGWGAALAPRVCSGALTVGLVLPGVLGRAQQKSKTRLPPPHRTVPGALGMSGLFLYLLVASAQGFHS